MSRYRVQLISSAPGLPAGVTADITDTYGKLFDTLEEAREFTERAMTQPPPAHTGRIIDTLIDGIAWETGPNPPTGWAPG